MTEAIVPTIQDDIKGSGCCRTTNKKFFIYDFDGTIYPYMLSCKKDQEYFDKLDKTVYKLILNSLKYGKVYVLTNATTDHVLKSIQTVLPSLQKILSKIRICSAREWFGCLGSSISESSINDLIRWKTKALDKIIEIDGEPDMIVSIGDSFVERRAVLMICDTRRNIKPRTIHVAQSYTIEELVVQLELLNCDKYLSSHESRHYDLAICSKRHKKNSPKSI